MRVAKLIPLSLKKKIALLLPKKRPITFKGVYAHRDEIFEIGGGYENEIWNKTLDSSP